MNQSLPIGLMKMGLRAQICSQCRPDALGADPLLASPCSCEPRCALFVQLPRLAQFLGRYRAKPPAGYEEFVLKLLRESASETSSEKVLLTNHSSEPGPYLDFTAEALASLERMAALLAEPQVEVPHGDCVRKALALGQMSVQATKVDAVEPQ